MKRTFYWALGLFVTTTLVSILLLNRYKVSLVYTVVVNATLQKSSPGDKARTEAAFERARQRADQRQDAQVFLQTLFAVSQRVEKVQKLSQAGSDEIIRMLDGIPAKEAGK